MDRKANAARMDLLAQQHKEELAARLAEKPEPKESKRKQKEKAEDKVPAAEK